MTPISNAECQSGPSIRGFLRPFPIAEFENQIKGKTHLHVKGPADKFSDILNWDRFNCFLDQSYRYLTHPILRLVLNGRIIPESQISEEVIVRRRGTFRRFSPNKIKQKTALGATVIIAALDEYLPTVAALVHSSSRELQETVKANCYFSPGMAQGFQLHYDTHDLFVLQIEGKKTWTLHGFGYPLPLESQPYTEHEPPTSTPTTVVLEKGDMLYLPRGYWHSATAHDTSSLHLTLGVHRLTRMDLIEWLVRKMEANAKMREDAARAPATESVLESMSIIKEELSRAFAEPETLARKFLDFRQRRSESSEREFNFQ